MDLAAIFSGGKDSNYALYEAVKNGHKVKYLVTVKPKNPESFMFHIPCIDLTKLQAKAMGIKQIFKEISGIKEREVEELKLILKEISDEIDGIVTGTLASEYQKNRIDSIAKELGLKSLVPLWHIDPEDYWKKMLSNGFKVMIISVSSQGLDKSWLGRIVLEKDVEELKKLSRENGFHLAFEGGEAETFVIDSPLFKERVEIEDYDIIWDDSTSSGVIKPKIVRMYKKY